MLVYFPSVAFFCKHKDIHLQDKHAIVDSLHLSYSRKDDQFWLVRQCILNQIFNLYGFSADKVWNFKDTYKEVT